MKLNKTLALAAIVAGSLLAGTTLQAQDSTNTPPAGKSPGGPGMHRPPSADMIAKELGLTDDQKAKVKTAMEEQQSKMKALHDDNTIAKEDKRAKAKEIRDSFVASMKEILTPEQFTKWQSHMPQHRPQGGPGGTPPSGGDHAPKQN